VIASLPMYDLPEVRDATSALWSAMRSRLEDAGVNAPHGLVAPAGSLIDHWLDPSLLMSQTCGYPFRTSLHNRVSMVGAFQFVGSEEQPRGWYRSVLIARAESPVCLNFNHASTAAINSADSLSGCVSLGWSLATNGIGHVDVEWTGAHVHSIDAVRSGVADLTSIDVHTWSLVSLLRPKSVAGLTIVGRGPVVASTPIITAFADLVPVLRLAIADAITDLSKEAPSVLDALQIEGFVVMEADDYSDLLSVGETAKKAIPDIVTA
jgi:ABC-type phosphate/phosphonate transport system substrate-binding protein